MSCLESRSDPAHPRPAGGIVSDGRRLSVDPIACSGHGICAELLPERIRLDDWGFPIVDGRDIPPRLRDHAKRAAAACPRLALRLRRP